MCTGSSSGLDAFVAAAEAAEAEGRAARAQQMREKLLATLAEIEKAVPGDVLAALGLVDGEKVVDGGTVRIVGACTFAGLTLRTQVSAGTYRVELMVDEEGVSLQGNVQANVGVVLQKLAARGRMKREAAMKRLLDGAERWQLRDEELQGRNLRAVKLPDLRAEELAQVRGIVARRKWAAHGDWLRWRASQRAAVAGQTVRAEELLAHVGVWALAQTAWEGQAQT